MRMRHIVIRGLSSSNIFLPHYLLNGTIFENMKKKVIECQMYFEFYVQLLYETFLILSKIELNIIKTVYIGLHVYYMSFFVIFEWNLHLLDRCSKNTQMSNFMKIHPVIAEVSHAQRRTVERTDSGTDRHDEANSRFSQFFLMHLTSTTPRKRMGVKLQFGAELCFPVRNFSARFFLASIMLVLTENTFTHQI
jgi:hypothetical protein